jgi:hypothetical protein
VRALTGLVLLLAALRPAAAQEAAPREPAESPRRPTARFLAGAVAGFGLHETAHVVAGLSFDARPRARAISYGVVPFFAIDHRTVSPRQELVISSAGFWAQHLSSEWLLSTRPRLRGERAPLLKGVLAFNLAASAVYGVAAFGGFGPLERDTRGIAMSVGDDGMAEPIVGVLIAGPALLDGYRYLRPESRWATWASRGMKAAGVALIAAAAAR